MSSSFTVVGSSGFVGKNLTKYLQHKKQKVFCPSKEASELYSKKHDVIIVCAGFGDCAKDPFKVVDANLNLIQRLIDKCDFRRMIVLSSTRVYMGASSSNECEDLIVQRGDSRALFNLTKLAAEQLCFLSNKDIVVVRPSNIFGDAFSSNLFLPSIVRDGLTNGEVNMFVDKSYSKDYISVNDLCDALYQLSIKETLKYQLYNIASGVNTSAGKIAEVLQDNLGCKINWLGSSGDVFPVTQIDRLQEEMNFVPVQVEEELKGMITSFRKIIEAKDSS